MTERTKASIIAFVLCSVFVPIVASDQPKEITEDDVKLRFAPADYLVADESVQTYDLTFGNEYGAAVCALKVITRRDKQGPNASEGIADALDLTLIYSEFDFRFEKPDKHMEAKMKAVLNDSEIDSFEYRARIDGFGNLIRTDLRARLQPLLKSSHESTRQLAHKMLNPMVDCTWLYLLPRLGPVKTGRVQVRTGKDWEAVAWPEFKESVTEMGPERYLSARTTSRIGDLVLWANMTRQTACKQYGASSDVKEGIKVEIHYDKTMKVIKNASVDWSTIADGEETVVSFKGVLRTE